MNANKPVPSSAQPVTMGRGESQSQRRGAAPAGEKVHVQKITCLFKYGTYEIYQTEEDGHCGNNQREEIQMIKNTGKNYKTFEIKVFTFKHLYFNLRISVSFTGSLKALPGGSLCLCSS